MPKVLLAIVTGSVLAVNLGGCVFSRDKERVVPAPAPVVVAPQPGVSAADRAVSYPDGRWQLYGEGSNQAPYFWAWVPAGTNPPPPPPPPKTIGGR